MCVCYARPNQWPDLDQTWHEGSLPPGAQLRGVKVGGGPQGAEPPARRQAVAVREALDREFDDR